MHLFVCCNSCCCCFYRWGLFGPQWENESQVYIVRLESKSIMHLEVAFTWIQIPKSPETLFNHASLIEQ